MKHTVTRAQLDDIADVLNIDGDDVRTAYSGRGMYGAECVGFDVARGAEVSVGAALALVLAQAAQDDDQDVYAALDNAFDIASNACIDSMGLGSVVYFPGLTVEA